MFVLRICGFQLEVELTALALKSGFSISLVVMVLSHGIIFVRVRLALYSFVRMRADENI
jgi:hypothetical protein